MSNGAKISDPPAAVVADPQDPLPESNWLWRRVLFIGRALIVLLLIGLAGYAISTLGTSEPKEAIKSLTRIVFWLCVIVGVDSILYTIAPSAEQATKMIATLDALKKGVSFRSSSSVKTDTAEATASSSATAAPPPPPTPPPAPELPKGEGLPPPKAGD